MNFRIVALATALHFALSQVAFAQTPPPFNPGSLPTKQVWENYFSNKQDLNFTTPSGTTGASSASRWDKNKNVVDDYGMVNDRVDETATWVANSNTLTGASFKASDTRKLIGIMGAGPNGTALDSKITGAGTIADQPSNPSGTYYTDREDCQLNGWTGKAGVTPPASSMGSGYVPGEIISVALGAGEIAPTQCQVILTGVSSITITAAGSGITAANGSTCIFTASGSPGYVQWQGAAVVNGTGLTLGAATVQQWGQYDNTKPIASLTVTLTSTQSGCSGITGATATLTPGVRLAKVVPSQPGAASSAPPSTQSQESTTGSGTGVSFMLTYKQSGAIKWGTDNTPLLPALANITGKVAVPAGGYVFSCPTTTTPVVTIPGSFVLAGDPSGLSSFEMLPGCSWLTQAQIIKATGSGDYGYMDLSFDSSYVKISNYVAVNPGTSTWLYSDKSADHIFYHSLRFKRMMAGWVGLFHFVINNTTVNNVDIDNIYGDEYTMDGELSHFGYIVGRSDSNGVITKVSARHLYFTGSNISFFNVDQLQVSDFALCCQAYGPALAIGGSSIQQAKEFTVHDGTILTTSGYGDVGESDTAPGIEVWAKEGEIHDVVMRETGGGGIVLCGEKIKIHHNSFRDVDWTHDLFPAPNPQLFQYSTAIAMQRVAAASCFSNGSTIDSNTVTDSYTEASRSGRSTAGLVPITTYGVTVNGMRTTDASPASLPLRIGSNNSFEDTINMAAGGSGTNLQQLGNATPATTMVGGVVDTMTAEGVNSYTPLNAACASIAGSTDTYTVGDGVCFDASHITKRKTDKAGWVRNVFLRQFGNVSSTKQVTVELLGGAAATSSTVLVSCIITAGVQEIACDPKVWLPASTYYYWHVNSTDTVASTNLSISARLYTTN